MDDRVLLISGVLWLLGGLIAVVRREWLVQQSESRWMYPLLVRGVFHPSQRYWCITGIMFILAGAVFIALALNGFNG